MKGGCSVLWTLRSTCREHSHEGYSVLWALRSTCQEHSHEGWLFSAMGSPEYLSGALS